MIRIEAGLCWKVNELLVNKHVKSVGEDVFLQAVVFIRENLPLQLRF